MADQISDAILDDFLRQDPEAKVACETFVSTGLAVIGGEVRSDAYVDIQHVARGVIEKIGYTKADYMFDSKSCGILSAVHEQSPDINRGVVREEKKEQGAGDQGMMFGYACRRRSVGRTPPPCPTSARTPSPSSPSSTATTTGRSECTPS